MRMNPLETIVVFGLVILLVLVFFVHYNRIVEDNKPAHGTVCVPDCATYPHMEGPS